jgi:hypothetical protein
MGADIKTVFCTYASLTRGEIKNGFQVCGLKLACLLVFLVGVRGFKPPVPASRRHSLFSQALFFNNLLRQAKLGEGGSHVEGQT